MGQVLDFAQFLNYKTIEVPVQCGSKTGKIYTFSHKDNLKNGLLKNYKNDLQSLIEKKKYEDSVRSCYDIGPTAAVANLIEDGEYAEFVKKYNHGSLKLTGFEHVLRVEENICGENTSHSILPLDEDCDFANEEQNALIRYSIFFKRLIDPSKDTNEGAMEWIFGGDGNAQVFRDIILKKTRVNQINGYPKIYSNCVIYKNLFSTIIATYVLNEEKVKETHTTKEAAGVFYEHAV